MSKRITRIHYAIVDFIKTNVKSQIFIICYFFLHFFISFLIFRRYCSFFCCRFVFCFYQIFFVIIVFNNYKNFNNIFLNNKRLFSTKNKLIVIRNFVIIFAFKFFDYLQSKINNLYKKKFDEIIKKIIWIIIITNQRFFKIISMIKNHKHSFLILLTYSNNWLTFKSTFWKQINNF